ncbi:DUF2752 domain-containing protein [Actinokineospora diospyrosa]|uniref:DUF2752 domain-containing protein n=1 Tax=Actinokineospora diospyrosa TaxID=103728 RepID=A0ABT1IB53_9PSEU|nr:DUF2752 domain-containing protein [Actinokineospora diospyrosa]MCP2269794.1 Protein of unknown function (DUF2752) [Actinokineospora diospyrosa]
MAWPVCPIKALTGLCCPGCGGTRMVLSLLDGRLADAAHYNAVALLFVALFGWVAVAKLVRARSWLDWRWTRIAALVVLCLWFVVRNVPGTGLYV